MDATIVKLGKGAKRSAARQEDLPLSGQACRTSHPAVRQLAMIGDVVRMKDQCKDPQLKAEVEKDLAAIEDRLALSLPKVWYGAFRLLGPATGQTPQDSERRYFARCACGAAVTLSATELYEAMTQHTGCRRHQCTQPQLLQLFWGSLMSSLRLQWRLLQVCHPSLLPSRWGGTADKQFKRDLEFGFARAWKEILSVSVRAEEPQRRWIYPNREDRRLSGTNLAVREDPWDTLVNFDQLAPVIAGARIPLAELCDSLGAPLAKGIACVCDEAVHPDELAVAILK